MTNTCRRAGCGKSARPVRRGGVAGGPCFASAACHSLLLPATSIGPFKPLIKMRATTSECPVTQSEARPEGDRRRLCPCPRCLVALRTLARKTLAPRSISVISGGWRFFHAGDKVGVVGIPAEISRIFDEIDPSPKGERPKHEKRKIGIGLKPSDGSSFSRISCAWMSCIWSSCMAACSRDSRLSAGCSVSSSLINSVRGASGRA